MASVACTSKATFAKGTVSNGVSARQMMVWQPVNNKMFETFSFLPPLTQEEVAKQVNYMVAKGYSPCIEVSEPELAYVKTADETRMGNAVCGYYCNRYWSMWKLPMFGCTDGSQVNVEIANCKRAFPDCYIRVCAFDSIKQVQTMSFLVNRPFSARDYCTPENRCVA